MPTTWLDYYVRGALEKARLGGVADQLDEQTDLAAMRFFCLATLTDAFMQHQSSDAPQGDQAAYLSLLGAVLHFTLDLKNPAPEAVEAVGGKWRPGRGLAPSAELVRALANAKAPATEDYWPALMEQCWYIDLPHRAILLGTDLQIRAVFIQPNPFHPNTASVVAILTQPGGNKMAGRFAWLFGKAGDIHGSSGLPVDEIDVYDKITHFIKLIMLYRLAKAKDPKDRPEYLPRIRSQDLAWLKPKKQQAKQKTHTLFSVQRMRPPQDRFGRPDSGIGRSWTLTHRVEVTGHFRWQPYGEQSARRKLIWIEPHMRGPQARREKPKLEVF